MAKKKTENIKAAPVLRAQDNEQLTPTPEQTGTRTYQIMDPWKDRDVVNLVDVKAVDGEITEVKVNGVPAGGGGGGTATVQIINNTARKGLFIRGPIIVNNMIMFDRINSDAWMLNVGSSATYTAPLASRGVQFYVETIPDPFQVIITGDCIWDIDRDCFIITGNCTITV